MEPDGVSTVVGTESSRSGVTVEVEPTEDMDVDFLIHREAISKVGNFFGILFLFVCVFVFGRWPQHSWLLLLGGDMVLPFLWYYHVVRYRRGGWYIVDICWFAALGRIVYFLSVYSQLLGDDLLEAGFRATFMYSTGFLSWCVIAFNNSLVFYSHERIANLWIHVMPAVVLMCLRAGNGFTEEVKLAWPGYFPEQVWETANASNLFGSAYLAYLFWLIPYAVWLFTMGLRLPEQGLTTAFNENYMRSFLRPWVTARTGIESWRAHAAFYLLGHFVVVSYTFGFALLTWYMDSVHRVWVVIIITYSVLAGSNHYIQTSVKRFGPIIRKRDLEAAAHAKAERALQSAKGGADGVELLQADAPKA